MEIFSYVVDGQLTHQDSMGNKEALSRGCVQYMSAGTGVHHSVRATLSPLVLATWRAARPCEEAPRPRAMHLKVPWGGAGAAQEMNEGDEPVRFVQVWLLPERHGHAPQYGSSVYAKQDRHNRLLQILVRAHVARPSALRLQPRRRSSAAVRVGSAAVPGTHDACCVRGAAQGGTGPTPAWPDAHDLRSIKLYQDANVFVSESDAGVAFEGLELGINRTAYLVCIEGKSAFRARAPFPRRQRCWRWNGRSEADVRGGLLRGAGRLAVNDTLLNTRDAARITGSSFRVSQLNITALQGGAHFLIIEMDKA